MRTVGQGQLRPGDILIYKYSTVLYRDTREGWPMLTVETEVKGTQRGQMIGVLLGNLNFFGPKWHSLCSLLFQSPKKS
jgi:hypothetical protein